MSDLEISTITSADTNRLDHLIDSISEAQVYPLLSEAGIATLKSGREKRWLQLDNDANNGHLKATINGQIVGFIRWRDGHFIYALYVELAFQGQGIGRQLLDAMLVHSGAREVRLRSSINAVDFYRHYGFQDEGDEAEIAGIRYVPMCYRVPNETTVIEPS